MSYFVLLLLLDFANMGDSKPEPPKSAEPVLSNSVETKIMLESDSELEKRFFDGVKDRVDVYSTLSPNDRQRLTLILAKGKFEAQNQLKSVKDEYEQALKARESAFLDALSSDSSGKLDEEKKKALGLQTGELIGAIKEGGDYKRLKLLDNVLNTVVAYSESKMKEVKAYESKLRELQRSAAHDSTRANMEYIRNGYSSNRPDEKFVLPPIDNTPKQSAPTTSVPSSDRSENEIPNTKKRNYNAIEKDDPIFANLTQMLNSAPGNFKA